MKKQFRNLKQCRGFALVITLSLLVLLAVIAVGLLTLSTVTVRTANLGVAQAEARANARLALILALGELQKAMGPDRRISARAETLAQHPNLGATVPANSAKAWWVGASNSDPEKGLNSDDGLGTNNPSVTWLISGLDFASSPATQISGAQPFQYPVDMYGDNTINTAALTSGQPIQAGRVLLEDRNGREVGGFAYFIDDNGMKAQLAATNPEVRNDQATPAGSGVLPGTYDLSILDKMGDLGGRPMEDYNRLLSLNDLPLIGTDRNIVREKRLGYTTLSRGVLSDVRKGGLKRDLTIAFEDDKVFTEVFGNKSSGFSENYIVMDPEKFQQSSDLKANGYIHWEMFKDFYNIKKHIGTGGDGDYLDSSLISKNGIYNGSNNRFKLGQLGPHDIGNNSDLPSLHRQVPYGEIDFIEPPSNTQEYRHNPITPVLARMHQNAWAELLPPLGSNGKQRLRTHVQLWKSQYNPYNIGLRVIGDGIRPGPRIMHYPQIYFTLDTGGSPVQYLDNGKRSSFKDIAGFSGKLQTSVPYPVTLGPGRAHVSAFKADGALDQGQDKDSQNYDDKVRDLTLESIYKDYKLASGFTGNISLTVDFVLKHPSMLHGANSHAGNNPNHEVAQAMWAPFAYEKIGGFPGKKIEKTDVSPQELNENTMASFVFKLRSTREGSGSVRPLIDANIRAMLGNTRWDSPLGLDCLAAYSPKDQGVVEEQIPQMLTVDNPKGYTYWGAGDDPADGYDRVILFDIPREDLVSLGQLQHAGIGRFSYEPSYIVGNSYANLRIPQEEWRASINDTFSTAAHGLADYPIPGSFTLYDASYLVNEELFDSYIFTTIPQVADNYSNQSDDPNPSEEYFEAVRNGEKLLPNPRFLPYEPTGSAFDRDTLRETTSRDSKTGAFYHNAGHLLVDGAFNVNSISVDAWEAFLSGTHQLPYQTLDENGVVSGFETDVEGVRFPRVQANLGGPMETDALDENFWIGFRTLKQEEVRELAEAIVEEIRERGPFLTLGEFINRKLDREEQGERGALQAALDRTVNQGLDGSFEEEATHPDVPEDNTQGAGFPGQLLQGDVLQALSPYMTVRSDTFTIRAYGESRNRGTNEVQAQAWCEATVQRYPDPLEDSSSNASPLAELVTPSSKFGRRFRITSFRWLSPAEI